MRTALIVPALLALLVTTGASAQGYPNDRVSRHRAVPYQVQDQHDYQQSGTRGRMGLGADSRYPEGPGNVGTPSTR